MHPLRPHSIAELAQEADDSIRHSSQAYSLSQWVAACEALSGKASALVDRARALAAGSSDERRCFEQEFKLRCQVAKVRSPLYPRRSPPAVERRLDLPLHARVLTSVPFRSFSSASLVEKSEVFGH